MYKWWTCHIVGLVLIFGVLWSYSKTEKKPVLVDKDQQIIDLINKGNDAQREIDELKDTIRSLNIQLSSSEVEHECALVVKDYERKVEKLEHDIKLLQGQVNANTKTFATCQEQLEDCNIRSHMSCHSEKSSILSQCFYCISTIILYVIVTIVILLGCGLCCGASQLAIKGR